jgi:hypothetical protein
MSTGVVFSIDSVVHTFMIITEQSPAKMSRNTVLCSKYQSKITIILTNFDDCTPHLRLFGSGLSSSCSILERTLPVAGRFRSREKEWEVRPEFGPIKKVF